VDRWSLKINDPTLIAWLCVAGYFVAAIVCALEANSCGRASYRRFWRGLALSCVMLGLNKQLDLHSYVLGVLRAFGGTGPVEMNGVAIVLAVIFAAGGIWAFYSVLKSIGTATRRMKTAL
jgi:hypothetical protein